MHHPLDVSRWSIQTALTTPVGQKNSRMSTELTNDSGYQNLLGPISEVYTTGQLRAHQAVNSHLTETYWQIGRDIVEFEQGGKARAEYGKALLSSLSRDLTLRHGKVSAGVTSSI